MPDDGGTVAVGAHPQREIAAALAECTAGGLRVREAPGRYTWGWVECVTGARSLAVPLVSGAPATHAKRIHVFLAEHRGHRAARP